MKMCGIVGYVGRHEAKTILVDGLKRLEYRGYDSAGIGLLHKGEILTRKKAGRVEALSRECAKVGSPATMGISHTRWATHGGVTDANAHPHVSYDGKICLVHNGVIENYEVLKHELEGHGIAFRSETDTEVLSHLIAWHYAQELAEDNNGHPPSRSFARAVRRSLLRVEGTYGIAVICRELDQEMIGARKGSPLVLGVGHNELFISSDVASFAGRTTNAVYLDDNQLAHIRTPDFEITTMEEANVEPVFDQISWSVEDAERGHFDHFMAKEIFEQPKALENAMRGRFSEDASTAQFGGLNMSARELRLIDRILFIGCGTAWHACLVAEYLIEKYARVPVEVEYASEFRYRNAPLDKNTLVFAISQSGETIDTLEAQREAQRKGYTVLGITNVVGSTIARENNGGVFQHSGPEIGVASTKAFTAQIHIAAMLALYFGRMRDMGFAQGREIVAALKTAPGMVNQILDRANQMAAIARRFSHFNDFLFLGRQHMFPIALEGALKLKEISYVHAEGYPAAEMKHGPIALICPECPTVAIALKGEVFHKVISNIQEIRARKGPVIVITDAGRDFPSGLADEVFEIPPAHEIVQPVLATIPMQLFAYHVALERGCDVDKPRNLAKSVTVE